MGSLILYALPLLLVLFLVWTVMTAPPTDRARRFALGLMLLPCLAVLGLNLAYTSGADLPAWADNAPAPLLWLCGALVLGLVVLSRRADRIRAAVFGVLCLAATAFASLVAQINLNQAFL